jgi:hypothetical protein
MTVFLEIESKPRTITRYWLVCLNACYNDINIEEKVLLKKHSIFEHHVTLKGS